MCPSQNDGTTYIPVLEGEKKQKTDTWCRRGQRETKMDMKKKISITGNKYPEKIHEQQGKSKERKTKYSEPGAR